MGRKMDHKMEKARNILVRAPNWIGDQVLAYPFFHFLRRAYPQARIVSACVPWVEAIQFRNLVNEVVTLPRPLRPGWGERLRVVEEGAALLRAKGSWDMAISLPNSLSAAWMLFRADARERRGYSADGRGLLLTHGLDWSGASSLHRAEAYVRLLPESAVPERGVQGVREFWGVPPENDLDPGTPGVLSRFDAAKAWPEAEPIEAPQEDYWVLAPGTTAASRRWPIERYAQLARLIASEKGWKGLIVGGVAEAPIAEKLCEDRSLRLVDRTAQGGVPALWKVFAGAKLTIANDSGLAHVASLCGSPVQVVWGAGNPSHTRPLGPGKVRVMFNPVECWPCEKNSCSLEPGQQYACLRGIEADSVWGEIKSGIKP